MMRFVAILSLLFAFGGEADAKRVMCACPQTVIVPHDGATVPQNGKIWVLPHLGAVHYPQRAPLRDLMGIQAHDDFYANVRVTKTDAVDEVPPEMPSNVSLTLFARAEPYTEITSLSVYGLFDNDTALIRIDIYDPGFGVASFVTSRDRTYLCEPYIVLMGGRSYDVEVRAIDLAGNESAPYATKVELGISHPDDRACGRRGSDHYGGHVRHRGHGMELIALLFFYGLGFIVWLIVIAVRRELARKQLPEDVPMLVAEEVVRRNVRWLAIWCGMLTFATVGLHYARSEMLPLMIGPIAIVNILRLVLAHRVVRALDREEASAVRLGRWLCVKTLRGSYLLRADDMDFVASRRASVPRSIAR